MYQQMQPAEWEESATYPNDKGCFGLVGTGPIGGHVAFAEAPQSHQHVTAL